MYYTILSVLHTGLFIFMNIHNIQEFGTNTVDAGLCQGVLITMHQQSVVKMYSFQHILDKVCISKALNLVDS